MSRHFLRITLLTGAIVAAACVEYAPLSPGGTTAAASTSNVQLAAGAIPTLAPFESGTRYLVVFKSGSPASAAIRAEIHDRGGYLEGLYDQLGFAVVSGLSADRAARLGKANGVSDVLPDVEFALEAAGETEALDASIGPQSATAPQTAALFALQWNMRAIRADAAWTAGALGSSNVRVAILDTGIDYRWPDLNGRVDLSSSISLRPDEDERLETWFGALNLHPITDLNAHGTLVSSIVASNSTFFAGVTTRTTLFGVKVCIVFNTCSTSATLNGIVYAVDHGADVINMSLGGAFLKRANPGFVSVISRVLSYATKNGTLIVVSAGNDSLDIDHDGNVYDAYCDTPGVVCVSATGPTAAPTVVGPFTNPDAVAPYTNFGRSAISLAAPGGGVTTPNAFVSGPCSQTALAWHQPPRPAPDSALPPPIIDGPGCPSNLGLFRVSGAGTSFASPHVAGVAAAVIASRGRSNPSQVRAILQGSSDDLGAIGTDPFYGKGRLNAARAVGAIP